MGDTRSILNVFLLKKAQSYCSTHFMKFIKKTLYKIQKNVFQNLYYCIADY